jgi:UDPglucose--hexose-1-phosphate uridylyltransferase
MSELRKDPIIERWVVMAPERAQRPIELCEKAAEIDGQFDPFAEGNEISTPPEILACRSPGSIANGPGWRVRVVPNKFPALQVEGSLDQRCDGVYDVMNGLGAHEVIIECPHGESNMSRLSVDNIREVLWVYRHRLADLKRDPRLVHALIFKNKGLRAGASLPHSHSQLIATPVVPITVYEEMTGALKFFHERGRSIFDEMIQQELASGSRVVLDTPEFLAFCPYASRFPFEIWIVPRHPGCHYAEIQTHALEHLAQVLKFVLQTLECALDDPPYNYVLHTAPFQQTEAPHYRWHIEIFPRTTRIAGFEWGSGFYINPVLPEDAAKLLRGCAETRKVGEQ